MSDYLCSQEDIVNKRNENTLLQLIGYYDPDEGARVIDYSKIDTAIVDATAFIYGYLANKYPVPFVLAEIDEITRAWLKQCAVKVALHFVFHDNDAMPQTVENDYIGCVEFLEKIRAGSAVLPGYKSTVTTSAAVSFLRDANGDKVFSRDTIMDLSVSRGRFGFQNR